ncbi:GGDEF domain-containing protein [Xanthobacter sediminis]|uniref:GGDEF domain-containing protein n=1 Tax=Xanthobacter sediminis TaxID=3119926 RepID=UPI0037268FD3
MAAGGLYLYTGPIVAFFFSALYLGVWVHRRDRLYVLILSLSFLCYVVAALSQMLTIPRDGWPNVLASTVTYTLCICLLAQGIAMRFGATGRDWLTPALAIGVVVLVCYFYFVDHSLVMRIYVQNFGYGIIVVRVALRVRAARGSGMLDRVFFWVLLLFGLHFFVRTALTAPFAGEISRLDHLIADGVDLDEVRRRFATSMFWQALNFSVFIAGLLIALMLFVAVSLDVVEDYRRESCSDTLTGLLNRRGFHNGAIPLWNDPGMRPLSIAYGDLDHFKSINDSFGHAAGDSVLRQFADLLSGELRHSDMAARFGGEEFVLLLPRAEGAKALAIAERVGRAMRDAVFEELSDGRAVTVSFGVAEAGPTETLAEVIQRADRMLYAAKRAGRDRCLLAPEVPGP